MSWLRSKLIQGYYLASLPQRKRAVRRFAKEGRAPISILYYHRVADEHPNPWTINNDSFQRHVLWMKQNFDMISLFEAQQRMQETRSQRPAVCITFDDGYGDNCDQALPFLVENNIPCTYFVSLGFCVDQKPFPHDVERNRPLKPNTVDELRQIAKSGIEIGGHTRNHPNLGELTDPQEIYDEVVTSVQELRKMCDQPIPYFAFPFGQKRHLNQEVFRVARETGFLGVCSAYGGYNFPGDDSFHLQRLHGDPMFSRIRNWLTFDRRVCNTERYEVDPPSETAFATLDVAAEVTAS